MHGSPAASHLGRTVREMVPELAPQLVKMLRQVLHSGQPVENVQFRVTGRGDTEGEHVWLQSIYPAVSPDGRVDGLQMLVQDITDVTRGEAAQELAAIVESANESIVGKTLDGRITSWNAGAQRMYGYTAKEMVGRSIATLIPVDRERELEEILSRIARGDWIQAFETERVTKDRGRIDVLLSVAPIRNAAGAITGASALSIDITLLRRTQAALAATAQELRLITNAVPVLIAYIDREYRFQFNNAAYESWFGLAEGSLKNHHVKDVIGERQFELIRPFAERALAGERVYYETEFAYPRAGIRFVSVNYVPRVDEEGTVLGYYAMVADITERKRAENALRESEERYRKMADHAPVMIWQSGIDGQADYFNKPWLDFRGQALEQELRGGWDAGVHPEDREEYKKIFLTAFRQRKPFRTEYRLQRADGEYRWVLDVGTPRFFENDAFAGYLGSCIDITERREAEDRIRDLNVMLEQRVEKRTIQLLKTNEKLRHEAMAREQAMEAQRLSEERYRLLAENTRDLICLHGIGARLIYISPSSRLLLHYSPEDLIGRNTYRLIHPDDRRHFRDHGFHPALRGEVSQVTYRFKQKEGEYIWVETLFQPVQDIAGRVVSLVTSSRDITQRRVVENELRQSEAALRQSQADLRALTERLITAQEDERRRLARELHDDLNQRMAVLAIELEKLQRSSKRPASEFRQRLKGLSQHVASLCDHTRNISHRLHPSVLDHLGLKVAIEAECEEFADTEGIKVRFTANRVPGTIPEMVALNLYRIAQQSLRNVALHARTDDVLVTLTGRDDQIELTVKDSGVGFDPQRMPPKEGLGLASMEERARVMHGQFLITSEPGKGTEVRVVAPVTGGEN